jgi:hypothetical protein
MKKYKNIQINMDAHLGVKPSPFASEAAVLETACAIVHQWAFLSNN